MRLKVKALAATGAIVWSAAVFITALANFVWPSYGQSFLQMVASIYPGYEVERSFASIIIGTLYALVDGAVWGAILAWLYNRFAGLATEASPRGITAS